MLKHKLYISIATTNNFYAETTTATRLQSQTVTFRDADPEWEVSIKPGTDTTRELTYSGDVELKDFFQRPIPIKSYTWTPGGTWTVDTFDPWTLYMSNPRVSNRITNYYNMSANLCIKFLINGNSFYYGRLMAFYKPLPVSDFARSIIGGTAGKIMNSQRLKMFIDPCESQAGVMRTPFAWYYDKINLTSSSQIANLGEVSIIALNELKHANGSSTPVNINVYAWLEDVKLSTPTKTNMALITTQAGSDEYGDGIVSAPATAVAKMSGKLTGTPMIGKYMRATSIAAGAVSNMAKLFGMSRPVDIEPPVQMVPRYVSGFAVTDVSDPVSKLTVDSKQELSVDSSITGYSMGDELGLKYIAGKETFLSTFNWNVAYSPYTIMFASRPSPIFYYRAGTPAYTTIPACTFAALPFKYWKGTMRYRFQVVSSAYHKGRMLVVWDPNFGATTPEQNVTYSKIIDISTEKDVTIDIGWGQQATWLEIPGTTQPGFLVNGGTYPTANSSYNGVVTAYVLNELTTPNSVVNNDIQVNVFVSMCDDAEFAAPHPRISTYSPFTQGVTPQAGGELDTEPDNNIPTNDSTTEKVSECIPNSSPSDVVYMGETISSFRQLMKRYALLTTIGSTGATQGYYMWSTSDFPIGRGYYSPGLRDGTTLSYNQVNTTMLNYLAMAFLMYRGGVRRKYILQSPVATSSQGTMGVNRLNNFLTYSRPALTTFSSSTQVAIEDQSLALNSTALEGFHMSPTSQQPVLEAELPFYTNSRFVTCRNSYSLTGTTTTAALCHQLNVFTSTGAAAYNIYVAAAEDSVFHCFQGCIPFQETPTFS